MNKPISGVIGGEIHRSSEIAAKSTSQLNRKEQSAGKEKSQVINDGVTLSRDQESEQPPEPPKMVKMKTFPQDAFMDEPAIEEIEQAKIGEKLEGPRVKAYDRDMIAIADPDGNFFYNPIDREFDQVNSFVCSYKTLDMHQNYLSHDIEWAFSKDQLGVNSHAGEGANAYYARWKRSINFFYFKSEGLEKTVQTSQSVDVVSHETGHAVLDGMKPRYLSSWGGETRAFHEAFGDATSMLYTLGRDDNLEKIVEETGGDLSKTNRLSMLAEEFGKAIRLMNDDPSDDDKTYLRNSRNEFKWVPIDSLPSSGPREELTGEPHSFARIFSGAFYDSFKNLYDRFVEELPPLPPPPPPEPDPGQGQEPVQQPGREQEAPVPPNQGQEPPPPIPDYVGAMRAARNVLGPIFIKGVELAPSSGASFKQIALGMLEADKIINEGNFKEQLSEAFINKNILLPEDIPEEEPEQPEMKGISMDSRIKSGKEAMEFLKKNAKKLGVKHSEYGDARIIFNKRGETTIEYHSLREIPLSSHGIYKVEGVRDLHVDIHGGMTLGFDKDGKLVSKSVDRITTGKIKNAVDSINKANKSGLIRRTPIFKGDNLFKSKNVPYKAEIYQEPSGKFKIRQVPIIVD